MGMRLAGIGLLMACAAVAQEVPQTPDSQAVQLQTELKKLGAAAQALQTDLPSFTCTETGLSQAMKKGKVKAQVRFVANVRVERAAAGRLDEELEVREVNGRAVKDRFDPPFMVGGGFGESLFYFLPATQQCFQYTLSAGRIDFVSLPKMSSQPGCTGKAAPTGFLLLDDAGNPAHLERTVQPKLAEQVHVVDFSAMDFMPTELDGKVYALTAKVVADEPKEDDVTLHFEATFAACHLFKATSRILPDVTPVPESGTPRP